MFQCLYVDVAFGSSLAIPHNQITVIKEDMTIEHEVYQSLRIVQIRCVQRFVLCYSRTLSRVAIPLSHAKQTHGPTSTHICLHVPTHLCQSPLRELGRGHHRWRARGACLTQAEPRPAWEMESSSYASCRLRWRGWRAGARTWRERRRRTNCQRRVSLGGAL